MSAPRASVYASLPATAILFAESLGIPRSEALTAAALTEADLSNPDELVPYETLLGVWALLISRSAGEAIGLRYAGLVPISIFGALGYAVAHCEDARAAFACYLRFSKLTDPYLEVQLITRGARTRMSIDHEPRCRALTEVMEMLVGATYRHSMDLVFGPGPRRAEDFSVHFRHAAAHSLETYTEFFDGASMRFDAEFDGIELPTSLLDHPIPAADPGLGRHLIASLEQELRARPLGAAPTMSDRVRARIESRLASGAPSQAMVARDLRTSSRTLQRRLAEEQTRFSEVLEEVRRDQAQRLLAQPALSVQEVAYLLGYSEPRAFHRAFRRWTGRSAGAWRAARGGK